MKKYIAPTLWIIAFEVISALMGLITHTQVPHWYNGLLRSSLNPPAYMFGIVWPALYVLLALTAYALWFNKENRLRGIKICFFIQILLNWSWTPVFFYLHLTGISSLLIVAMLCLTTYCLIGSWKQRFAPGLMLIPYWFWIVLACYLNAYIWWYN